MRKKSHIALSHGIVYTLPEAKIIEHKLALYVGSIWPDCVPSFLTRRHCIDKTYDIFIKKANKYVERYAGSKKQSIMMSIKLGIVMHYVADYFTYPHNEIFGGSFKDHCIYEEYLKKAMYAYVSAMKNGEIDKDTKSFCSVEEMAEYIKEKHMEYMKGHDGDILLDCSFSTELCMCTAKTLISLTS